MSFQTFLNVKSLLDDTSKNNGKMQMRSAKIKTKLNQCSLLHNEIISII